MFFTATFLSIQHGAATATTTMTTSATNVRNSCADHYVSSEINVLITQDAIGNGRLRPSAATWQLDEKYCSNKCYIYLLKNICNSSADHCWLICEINALIKQDAIRDGRLHPSVLPPGALISK